MDEASVSPFGIGLIHPQFVMQRNRHDTVRLLVDPESREVTHCRYMAHHEGDHLVHIISREQITQHEPHIIAQCAAKKQPAHRTAFGNILLLVVPDTLRQMAGNTQGIPEELAIGNQHFIFGGIGQIPKVWLLLHKELKQAVIIVVERGVG